ncbi:MAG: molecular chaperone DjlA [Acetobacteraceae bacterium]|nr:molecular chaperone DjlA [Acetobacteraceae bacterium]
MGYWGKVFGGMAGFAMGGPFGAAIGAALGHAADSGLGPRLPFPFSTTNTIAGQAKVAAMLGRKDQLFSIAAVVLSAKLAKCDGPVKRGEIDMFRRQFRIPDTSVRDIGRLFDQARDTAEGFELYASQLGDAFADNTPMLEIVLASLFAIARADGAVNAKEHAFLSSVHRAFRLDRLAWDRASGAIPARPGSDEPDPYEILGVPRSADGERLRAVWKNLMRENHPDALAARGVPPEFIEKASASVARINAAWDRIKRERGL